MGLFTLSREALCPTETDGTFSRAFGAPIRRSAAGYTLRLFGKLNGLPPVLVDGEDDDFIAQTGTLYFRGKTGAPALAALLGDFDGKRFPWSECRGHFAVVLRWQRRLFVATDALGAYKIYRDRAWHTLSSSFVAVQATLPRVTIDKQGCYEYAWNGATFGEKTFFDEIRVLRQGMLVELTPRRPVILDEWDLAPAAPSAAGFEETAQRCVARLRALIRTYAAEGDGRFGLTLSGGGDARLLLALLLDAELRPELLVYRDPRRGDVDLAREIARREGLPIEVLDRTAPRAALDAVARLRRAHDHLDGWHAHGVLDASADAEDRLARAAGGRLLVNGALGEIYRNFFNLPDGRYELHHLIAAFYSHFTPRACTPAFDVHEYTSALVTDMRRAVPLGDRWLTREAVEALYPLHRGRYWTARDVAVESRFGRTLFPFLEPAVIEGTEAIPIAFKQHGRLEARMIEILRPALAQHPTTRGLRPAEAVPWWRKLASQLSLRRPAWLRPYGDPLRHRHARPRPEHLRDAAVRHVIDPTLPVMRAYFHPEHIHDPDVLSRVCTMEWLSLCPIRAAARAP